MTKDTEQALDFNEVAELFDMFYGIGAKPYSGDNGDILSILWYID